MNNAKNKIIYEFVNIFPKLQKKQSDNNFFYKKSTSFNKNKFKNIKPNLKKNKTNYFKTFTNGPRLPHPTSPKIFPKMSHPPSQHDFKNLFRPQMFQNPLRLFALFREPPIIGPSPTAFEIPGGLHNTDF